ncbi:MAG: phosphoribosylformylglycinamidine synthase, partial [Alloalcanivorax venustensis]
MLILPGSPALSAFRKEKLLEALPQAEALSARFVHFVELSPTEGDAGLDERERQVLDSLLEYGPSLEDAAVEESGSETFVVVPRPGTVSPWSSKATDICHNAGLAKVARVERGIEYRLKLNGPADRGELAAALHDRMVEAVLDRLEDAEVLFTHHRPRPLTSVDVIGG